MAGNFSPEDISSMKAKYPEDTALHEMLDTLTERKPFVIRRHQKEESVKQTSGKRTVTLLLGVATQVIDDGNVISNRVGRSISKCKLEDGDRIDANLIRKIEKMIEEDHIPQRGRFEVSIFSVSVLEG